MTAEEKVRVVVVPFGTEKTPTLKAPSDCLRAVLPARQITGLIADRISA